MLKSLIADGPAPSLVALENVCGTLHSHDGKDFATICNVFQQAEYRVGALVIDAELFVPQSRPRLFIIGMREDIQIPEGMVAESSQAPWHTNALKTAYENLPPKAKRNWLCGNFHYQARVGNLSLTSSRTIRAVWNGFPESIRKTFSP